jgi:hypothetical protein
MSTRCTIRFFERDCDDEIYYVYRHSDGFADEVIPEIEKAIEVSKGRWSGAEVGSLVTLFLAMYFNYQKQRIPSYELTPCIHGDESTLIDVVYQPETKSWIISERG